MNAGLRKRVAPYVKVPSSTIRDGRASYRARGVLAYLLDMPDGWDVRSEAIAGAANGEKGEGREAVRTALHELGRLGYYRIERRQLSNGTFAMGTAVSELPVPEWADQYEEYSGKPVTVVEQEDGTWKVRHKDGSLTGDGFSGAGSPGAGQPDAGAPEVGEPEDGSPVAISSTDTQDSDVEQEGTTEKTDDSLRSSSALFDVPAADDTEATEPEVDLATKIAQGWWDYYQARYGQIMRNGRANPFLALRNNLIQAAIEAGYTETEIKKALMGDGQGTPDPVPAKGAFQRRLVEVRQGVTRSNVRPLANVHHVAADDPDRQRRIDALNGVRSSSHG